MKSFTEEQRKEFERVCKPVMEFLCKNCHPHVKVIIEPTTTELLEGQEALNLSRSKNEMPMGYV